MTEDSNPRSRQTFRTYLFDPSCNQSLFFSRLPATVSSIASVYRHWTNRVPNPETEEAIKLVKNGLAEIKRLDPRYWLMENPMGMLRTVIGKPRSTIRQSDFGSPHKKLTDLWGNVPLPMLSSMGTWLKAPRGDHKNSIQGQGTPASRAKWPYGLSKAVMEAVS